MGGHELVKAGADAEFNARLDRTDGDSVAGVLHQNLAKDRSAWLDEQVLPRFRGSPCPEQTANGPRCRAEVSIFQAVEAANIAREGGYVAENRANWFADWLLRLILGAGAGSSAHAGL